MGRKRSLLDNKTMKRAVSKSTDSLDEFYLSDELISEIFEHYKKIILEREMCSNTRASYFNVFKHIENRGISYLSKYISRILTYSQDFLYKRANYGRPSYFERINNR